MCVGVYECVGFSTVADSLEASLRLTVTGLHSSIGLKGKMMAAV